MSLKNCIITARDAKEISPDDADVLIKKYDALARAIFAPEEIKRRMTAEIAAEAEQRKRASFLGQRAFARAIADVDGYRHWFGKANKAEGLIAILEHYGSASFRDIEHGAKAILGMAQAEMGKHLDAYKKGALLGDLKRRMGETAASLDNVAREAFGHATGDAKARGFYQAWAKVAEDLRQRFNAAGGAIGKLKDWGLPQLHDALAMDKAGKEAWIAFTAERLDAERMSHPLTGEKMTATEVRESLDHVYDTIITDGNNSADPTGAKGRGALFKRHADHRFLVFKNGDAWLEYQKAFGGGDVYASMIAHLRTMSREIAMMERLGPNPDYVFERLLKHVEDSATIAERDKVRSKLETARAMYEHIKGNSNVPVNGAFAATVASTRNIISAASLGSAPITALADQATIALARVYSGLPIASMIGDVVREFGPHNRLDAAESGILADNYLSVMHQEARAQALMSGPEWTRFIADRTHALSGLSPLTQAEKNGYGRAMMHEIAKNAGKSWEQMPGALRRLLDRNGFDATSWEKIRAADLHAPPDGIRMLRAKEIAASAGNDLAERYLMMIYRDTKFAIPESTIRSTVALVGESQPGTVRGELMRSIGQFKSFGVALVMMQGSRIAHDMMGGNVGRGAAYAGGLLFASTMMGALSLQLKEIAQGRDPRKMVPNDAKGAGFWGAALLQGGGLGIFGDFLLSDVNRNGGSLARTILGPTFDRVDNLRALTVGNAIQFGQGEKTNFGRELTRFVKQNTPGSTIWWLRLAAERVVFDQLQYLLDKDAHQAFRRTVQQRKRDYGNEFWSAPGSGGVQRGPNFGAALGSR